MSYVNKSKKLNAKLMSKLFLSVDDNLKTYNLCKLKYKL